MKLASRRPQGQRVGRENQSDDDDEDELSYEPEEIQHRRDPEYRFRVDKEIQQMRLQLTFEDIIQKYSRDFSNIGDEIDLLTGEIVVDRGHIRGMRNEKDMEGFGSDSNARKDSKTGKGADGEGVDFGLKRKTSAAVPQPSSTTVAVKHSTAMQPRHAIGSHSGDGKKLSSIGMAAMSPLAFEPLDLWGKDVAADPLWRAPELPIPRFKSSFAANLFADKYSIPVRDHTNSLWAPGGDRHQDDDAEEIQRLESRTRSLPLLRRAPKMTMKKLITAPLVGGSDEEDSILLGPKTLPPVFSSRVAEPKPPAPRPVKHISGKPSQPERWVEAERQPTTSKFQNFLPSPESSFDESENQISGVPVRKDKLSTPKATENQFFPREGREWFSQTLFVELRSSFLLNDSSYISFDDETGFPTPPASDCESASLSTRKSPNETRSFDVSAIATAAAQHQKSFSLSGRAEAAIVQPKKQEQPRTTIMATRNDPDPLYYFSDEERGYTKKRKRAFIGLVEPTLASTALVPLPADRPQKRGRLSGCRSSAAMESNTHHSEATHSHQSPVRRPVDPGQGSNPPIATTLESAGASIPSEITLKNAACDTTEAGPAIESGTIPPNPRPSHSSGGISTSHDMISNKVLLSEDAQPRAPQEATVLDQPASPEPLQLDDAASEVVHSVPNAQHLTTYHDGTKTVPVQGTLAARETPRVASIPISRNPGNTPPTPKLRLANPNSKKLRTPSTAKTPTKPRSSRTSPATPARRTSSATSTPKSTRTLISLVSEDELASSPQTPSKKKEMRPRKVIKPDFFTRIADEKKTTPGTRLGAPASAAASASAKARTLRRSWSTPIKLNSKKDLFYSPGGTLSACGENGKTCGGDFCMTCFGEGI